MLKEITNGGSTRIEPGHVIYLDSCIEDIKVRNTLKHKYWPEKDYRELIERIENIYDNVPRSVICTRGRNAAKVAREIAKVIFLEEYKPTDIHAQLQTFAGPSHV